MPTRTLNSLTAIIGSHTRSAPAKAQQPRRTALDDDRLEPRLARQPARVDRPAALADEEPLHAAIPHPAGQFTAIGRRRRPPGQPLRGRRGALRWAEAVQER